MWRPRSDLRFDQALVALALVLSLAVALGSEQAGTSHKLARQNNWLDVWSPEQLQSITLQRGEQRTSLEKRVTSEGTVWRLDNSATSTADPEAVRELINTLELSTWLRRVADTKLDRSGLGLAEPKAVVILELQSGSVRLTLGGSAPTPPGAHYLELERDGQRPVLGVIAREVADSLSASLDRFRGRALWPHSTSELQGVTLETAQGTWSASRHQNLFRFGPPRATWLLSPERLDLVLFQLPRLVVDAFLALDVAETQLAEARVKTRLTLTTRAGERTEILVGGTCPHDSQRSIAIKRGSAARAGCVPGNIQTALEVPPEELIDKTPFTLPVDGAERLRIERQDGVLELARAEDAFELRAPERAPVALEAGNARLRELVDCHGQLVEPGQARSELGLDPPAGSITLSGIAPGQTEAITEIVELGKPTRDGRLPVRRAMDGAVLLLQPKDARAFNVDRLLLRSDQVVSFDPDQLTWLELEHDGVKQTIRRTDSGFVLETPKGYQHDERLVGDLLETLSQLKALKWISEHEETEFGLASEGTRVRWRTLSSELEELRLGRRGVGGVYASLNRDGVFLLSPKLAQQLTPLLISRAPFKVDLEKLNRVTLTTRNGSVTLRQRGDAFVADDPAVAAGLASALAEALAQISADAAIELGRGKADYGFEAPSLRVELRFAGGEARTLLLGASDIWRDRRVFFARSSDVEATFAVPQGHAETLLDLL